MNKEDYKTLERDEVLSLAESLRIKIEESGVVADLGGIGEWLGLIFDQNRDNLHQSEKGKELENIITEVKDEVFRRFRIGRNLFTTVPDGLYSSCFTGVHISFVVREDRLCVDCCVPYGQVKSYEFHRKDGKKEIPDEKLLHEKPYDWLTEYIRCGLYEQSPIGSK